MARRKTNTTATASEAAKPAPAATEAQENRITIVGRLVADPVLRHTKSGKAVSTIRVAVNEPDTKPTFHKVVVWERTAEVVCEYLRKGRAVEVIGRTQERTYQDADGNEHRVNEISAWRVQFLSRPAPEAADEKEVA